MKEGQRIELDEIVESLPENQIDYVLKESEQPEISPLSIAFRLKSFLLNDLIDKKSRELQKIEKDGEGGALLLREIKDLVEEREQLRKEVSSGI